MKKLCFVLLLLFALLLPSVSLSHSGGTDSQGGHYNRSTGEYHYHHGYPAHQHENGICPYEKKDTPIPATPKPTSAPVMIKLTAEPTAASIPASTSASAPGTLQHLADSGLSIVANIINPNSYGIIAVILVSCYIFYLIKDHNEKKQRLAEQQQREAEKKRLAQQAKLEQEERQRLESARQAEEERKRREREKYLDAPLVDIPPSLNAKVVIYPPPVPSPKPTDKQPVSMNPTAATSHPDLAAQYRRDHLTAALGYISKNAKNPDEYLEIFDSIWGDMIRKYGDDKMLGTLTSAQRQLIHFPPVGQQVWLASPKARTYHATQDCYMLLKSEPIAISIMNIQPSYKPCSKCMMAGLIPLIDYDSSSDTTTAP